MTTFAWSEDYRIGYLPIDAQHRRMFGIAGRLQAAAAAGHGHEALGPALADLVAYTRTHFATEERLMRMHRYPGLGSHMTEHQILTRRVLWFQRQFESGAVSVDEILQVLKVWLAHHIAASDRRIGAWLTARTLQQPSSFEGA